MNSIIGKWKQLAILKSAIIIKGAKTMLNLFENYQILYTYNFHMKFYALSCENHGNHGKLC
jgi:hypothetical protein